MLEERRKTKAAIKAQLDAITGATEEEKKKKQSDLVAQLLEEDMNARKSRIGGILYASLLISHVSFGVLML
jgi:hypothetical protein